MIFVISHYLDQGLCIIGYHGIVSDELKETQFKNNPYYMSTSQFEKQMKYLVDHQYTPLTMDEVYDYYQGKPLPPKAICITFDDGYKNFNTEAKPILKKYHLKATCFVMGNHLVDSNDKFLKEKDLVNDETVQYYSHTYSLHVKTNNKEKIHTLSVDEINDDFDKEKIVDLSYIAYPYGAARNDLNDVLKSHGVKLAFTYNNFKDMNHKNDAYHIPRYMIVSSMPMIYYKWVVN